MIHRPLLRLFKKQFLFLLVVICFLIFVLTFLFMPVYKRNAIDEDPEELDIDLLKDKIIKLKRSHFLNRPINPEDLETESIEQAQNHTFNHKKLFNSTLDFNSLTNENCRNSIQGKLLITDERGYTCKRHHLTAGGCCDLQKPNTKRYSCETCNELNCCEIIEYCISCCLEPSKKSLLQKVLSQQSSLLSVNANREQHTLGINILLFASVTDLFELCLTKCRTSSQSVQHENSYKNSRHKHCFGLYIGNEIIKKKGTN